MWTPDQLEGGLLGLLIGDAVGVPYEFKPPTALPPRAQLDMVPPPGFPRTHAAVPPGTWSDDGAQALCLLESLLEHDGLKLADFADRMVRWYEQGHLAVDRRVFDIGIQTQNAFYRLAGGASPRSSGGADEMDNGNGSLMRVLPLALWHRGTDSELVADAHEQSLPTHGHPRSQVCCALYCLWARREAHGSSETFRDAAEALHDLYADDRIRRDELAIVLGHPGASGSGYVVDCLHSARHALEQRDFASVVRAAIALGNDTDTTAAVAGGIAGIRFGAAGIPEDWRTGLRGQELLTPLLAGLTARAGDVDPTMK